MNAQTISVQGLMIAYLCFLLPVFIFWRLRTGLGLSLLWSVSRMTVQLLLLGLYLGFLFEEDRPLWNAAWAFAMCVIAAGTIVRRAGFALRHLIIPVFLGLVVTVVTVETIFLLGVIGLEDPLAARYFIPITGMLLGNSIATSTLALRFFYKELQEKRSYFEFCLGMGASRNAALRPFISEALQQAFQPVLASMSVIGLIALPGMLTGQILGGSDPDLAARYQLMIMLAIFLVSSGSVLMSLYLMRFFVFDRYSQLHI